MTQLNLTRRHGNIQFPREFYDQPDPMKKSAQSKLEVLSKNSETASSKPKNNNLLFSQMIKNTSKKLFSFRKINTKKALIRYLPWISKSLESSIKQQQKKWKNIDLFSENGCYYLDIDLLQILNDNIKAYSEPLNISFIQFYLFLELNSHIWKSIKRKTDLVREKIIIIISKKSKDRNKNKNININLFLAMTQNRLIHANKSAAIETPGSKGLS